MASNYYHLQPGTHLKWTSTQEQSISRDFPTPPIDEATPSEKYIKSTYLQFLWLPQSLVPLPRLISAMRQIRHSEPTLVHPLHELLDNNALATARAVAQKYQTELAKTIATRRDSIELEVQMMWLRYSNEKGSEYEDMCQDGDESNRLWLAKMERREVQIQILLYMLKLSLPGPPPACAAAPKEPPPDGSPKKRMKPHADVRAMQSSVKEPPTPMDKLEAFMDKLATWQLVGELEDVPDKPKGERDWMQVFCEDVVELLFKRSLPRECDLLRSKVFSASAFSDEESEEEAESQTQPMPPSSSSSSRPPASKKGRRSTAPMKDEPPSSLVRPRSRSLSVSLAEEKEQQGLMHVRKRPLVREVSMSRSAPKRRRVELLSQSSTSAPRDGDASLNQQTTKHCGETLVEETPVKARTKSSHTSRAASSRGLLSIPSANLFPSASRSSSAVSLEEEDWELAGSSGSPATVFTDDWERDMDDMDISRTPTKVR